MSSTTWRTAPEYHGHVADGFYLSGGRLCYEPLPDPADVRRRLAKMIGDDEPPATVSAVAIDGQLPTVEQVEFVRRELQKAPAKVLADFSQHHGRVEVVPHGRAKDHPVARRFLHGWSGFGFCSQGSGIAPLIVVEADEDAGTTLHELGHFVDRGDRFSSLSEWQRLSAAATAIADYGYSVFASDGPLANLHNARRSHAECFCEAFAVAFHSPRTRQRLSGNMVRFIERACNE